ncbi:hypothetical protein AWENTII_005044 [Aspergillus wentii]
MGMNSRSTNERVVRAIMKLMYYIADEHRPSSWAELADFTRDAGPRLLRLKIDYPSCPLPISRHHPELPAPDAVTHPEYVRPPEAPASLPDSYVERKLLTANTNSPDAEEEEATGVAGGDGEEGNGNDDRDNRRKKKKTRKTQAKARATKVKKTKKKNTTNAPPTYNEQAVVEAVERAVMQFAYGDLKRHPSAAPQFPRPSITATTEGDLLKSVIGSFSAISDVTLSEDASNRFILSLDPNGAVYRYRGRGPVWNALSCAVDSVIVAGKLLDAGSTMIDRKEDGWQNRFTEVERAFIEATDINWDVCSWQRSMELRDQFWCLLAAASPNIQLAKPNPPVTVWAECTKNFAQFQFAYGEAGTTCACQGANQMSQQECYPSLVKPPVEEGDQDGVSMQEVIARYFAPYHVMDCASCGAKEATIRAKSFDSLPLRMAVALDESIWVRNHTEDIHFTYDDGSDEENTAHYRWLGGVYFLHTNFRVFWTDSERGEANTGEIRTYDPINAMGTIVGGIPPEKPDDRVPAAWWHKRPIPLLFYERVMDPEPGLLEVAQKSIHDMILAQNQEKPIFHHHTPWAQSDILLGQPSEPLWIPLLPTDGNRYHTSSVAYQPAPSNGQADTQALQTTNQQAYPWMPISPQAGFQPQVYPWMPTTPGTIKPSPTQASTTPAVNSVYQTVSPPMDPIFSNVPSSFNTPMQALNAGLPMFGFPVPNYASTSPPGMIISPQAMNTSPTNALVLQNTNDTNAPASNSPGNSAANTQTSLPATDSNAMQISPPQQTIQPGAYFWAQPQLVSPPNQQTTSQWINSAMRISRAFQPRVIRIFRKRKVEEVEEEEEDDNDNKGGKSEPPKKKQMTSTPASQKKIE